MIATVATGLYVSWNGPLLISASTRLQGIFFWDMVTWLIEGVLFPDDRLPKPACWWKNPKAFQSARFLRQSPSSPRSLSRRASFGFPGTYLTRIFSKRLTARDPLPSWRAIVVIGFTGIRGVVSLAVALAVPLTLPNGEEFPYRDFILFVTFGVIFVTLVGIGLTLPLVVKALGLSKHGQLEAVHEREAEIAARREIIETARGSLDKIIGERNLPEGLARFLEARHETRMRALPEPRARKASSRLRRRAPRWCARSSPSSAPICTSCCATARSPTKPGGGSNAISILRKPWWTIARTARFDRKRAFLMRSRRKNYSAAVTAEL